MSGFSAGSNPDTVFYDRYLSVPYGWGVEQGAEHRPREPGQRDGDGRHAARVLGKGHSSCPYSSDRGGMKKKEH